MASIPLPCEALVREAVEAAGCSLYALFATSGRARHLTLLIDTPSGATTDDCERVIDQLHFSQLQAGELLSRYQIDVATPGVDRPLLCTAHYELSLNHWIEVKLHHAILDYKKILQGYLISMDENHIDLELAVGNNLTIDYSNIAKARWVYTNKPNREA